MSENKTLEEEILTINCQGIEEADRIRGEFSHVDDIDRNLNELAQRMTNAILSLVVARIPKEIHATAILGNTDFNNKDNNYRFDGDYHKGYNQHYAGCIQAIRGK